MYIVVNSTLGPTVVVKLFCAIAEREYNSTVSLIESGLVLPIFALRQLKSQVKLFQQLVLEANDIVLTEIEQIIITLGEVLATKAFSNIEEKRMAFCQAAFACRAVMETLFPPDGASDGSDDPVYAQIIPLDIRNTLRTAGQGYDDFEKYVCKLSLRVILESFTDDYIEWLENKLDEILDALGLNKIDELIEIYMSKIGDIMELLETLDKFSQCAFEVCNFAATSINKQEDTADKLSVIRQGDGWSFKIEESIQAVYDQEASMRLRIANLRSDLRNLQGSVSGQITPDKVFK